MQLFVEDVARLLNVPEETVYRWVNQGEIPFHRVNRQYRFARAEIMEWATARRLRLSPAVVSASHPSTSRPATLLEALESGRIIHNLEARNRDAILQAIAGELPLPADTDREFLLQMLRTQEEFVAAGNQDGIVIQHVRNPIVLNVPAPTLTLFFLANTVSLGGTPVRAIFVLVSPSVRVHLHLLSRLALLVQHPQVRAAIGRSAASGEILAAVRQAESDLAQEHPSLPPQPPSAAQATADAVS